MSKTPNDITRFIRTELKTKIEYDFLMPPFRIFRESDLHACCYFHLRCFIGEDHKWEMCNEPYVKDLKGRGRAAQPDLVLFYKKKPVALIEVKFRKKSAGIPKKEQRVLRRAVKQGRKIKRLVKKAYYLEVVVQPRKEQKRIVVKRRNKVMSLSMAPETLQDYLALYRQRHAPTRRRKRALQSAT